MPKPPRTTDDPLGKKLLAVLAEQGHPDDLNVLAEALGVRVQSTYDYIKHGRLSRDRYPRLVAWSKRPLDWWFDVPSDVLPTETREERKHYQVQSLQPAASKWEFEMVDRSRWNACSPLERGYVQGAMNAALTEVEQHRRKPRNGSLP